MTHDANPFEQVRPAEVALVLRGRIADFVNTGWLADGEAPDDAKWAIMLVSCHSEVLGILYPQGDHNTVSFLAREIADQTPGRSLNLSRPSNRRLGDQLRRRPHAYLPFTNVGVRELTVLRERRGSRRASRLSDMRRGLLEAVGLAPLDGEGWRPKAGA